MKYLLFIVLILGALAIAEISRADPLLPPTDCVGRICQKLSPFRCDEPNEIRPIARACAVVGTDTAMECFDAITGKLNPFEVDRWSELKPILEACRFNWGTSCLDTYAVYLSPFDLNSAAEWARAAESCQFVNPDCVRLECDRLGALACHRFREIHQIARSCRQGI